jgi:hypothetical protein
LQIEKAMTFECLSTSPFNIPEMAAIPLDLPVRPPPAQEMMNLGEIPKLIELIHAFQHDIPGGELSLTEITDCLAALDHSRKGKIDIRSVDPWSPISLLVFLNNFRRNGHVQKELG